MDLKHLRYFAAVVEHGSFHAASKRLDIAQPALSRRVQDLEAFIGCALLDRSVRGVTPTPAGRVLHREARRILDDVAQAANLVRSTGKDQDREVSLGLVRSARKYDFVHHALAELAQTQPAISVSTTIGASPALAADLREGRLDLSLIYEQQMDMALFAERLIHRERYILAVHPGHRLAGSGPVGLSDLDGEQFVWLLRGENLDAYDPVLEHCRLKGLIPRICQTARTHSELIDIVSTTGGLCITPISTVMTIPQRLLVFRSIPELTLELDLFLAWNPKARIGALVDTLNSLHRAIDKHQAGIEGGHSGWTCLDGAAQVRIY